MLRGGRKGAKFLIERATLEVVTGEARKVEAKNLRTYTWTVSIQKTGWKLILTQNIGN